MSYAGSDTVRIRAEYERRAREIPRDFYSLGNRGNLLIQEQTARGCIEALKRAGLYPLRGRRILDVGCGVGSWLLEFEQWGADPGDLAGIDLMPDRMEETRRRVPQADLRLGSAAELPWPDNTFDIASQMLVFTNMLDARLKQAVAAEMLRVVKPGGGILWFDLRVNNPRNPEVKGLAKAEIGSLFRGCEVYLKPVLLAPPLSRSIAPRSWLAAEVLSALPFLRTHYAGFIRKRAR